MQLSPPISRVILYVHSMPEVSAFYQTYFGFREEPIADTDLLHLTSSSGGCAITLLQASKGQKRGQSLVKLVFDVEDVEAFKQASAERGLHFGTTHHGAGYAFANARDPAQNLIQISSRRFTKSENIG
ncbi:MAG: VOC family protein [Chloroflexales bacterium]|nr:VOC family protein [Chloroflexales bacterium]